MNFIRKYFRKPIYLITAILAGIFLFTALSSYDINRSLLNPNFHKSLFTKNNIYSHTHNLISNSMTDFINGIKNSSPQNYEQHKEIFLILEKSITPEMVKNNLDSIRDGLFQYFRGERYFLPDIYMNNQLQTEGQNNSKPAVDERLSPQSLAKIEKINLSAILMYINRNDIIDQVILVKFVYYTLDKLPGFSIALFLLATTIGLCFSRKNKQIATWFSISFFSCGFLCMASGIGLFAYSRFIMVNSINLFAMYLPIQKEVIISYLSNCTNSISMFIIIFGGLLILLSAAMRYLPTLIPVAFPKADQLGSHQIKTLRLVKYFSIALCIIFLSFILGNKIMSFKKDFEVNNFASVISKFQNTTVTQVISAKDETIYTLQVKILDAKSGNPIPNIWINIDGKSSILKKSFNETSTSDSSGSSKFTLDEGTFRLSFVTSYFPAEYQIPSPFFFDLKLAGTTIITINLEKAPEINKPKLGIAEIEVLDKDNNPIPNLQLTIQKTQYTPDNPDNIHSFTNPEGIAVFKIDEGSYKAAFSTSDFPKEYQVPTPMDITIVPNVVSRYTLKLAEIKNTKKVTNSPSEASNTTNKKAR